MRKMAAILFAIALMLTMAVPALANESISDLEIAVTNVELEQSLSDDTLRVEVQEANTDNYTNNDVKTVVAAVNSTTLSTTVEGVAQKMKDYLPADTTLSSDGILTVLAQDGGEDTVLDLKEFDFVTNFKDLVLTDGSKVAFDDNGRVVSAKMTMIIDALKGETDLSNYRIMLINPDTGASYFIELDPASFNSETGEITVDFPCLGAFSLIQK